jgi:hypothetical protein
MIIQLSIVLTLGLITLSSCTNGEKTVTGESTANVQAAMKEFVDAKLAERNNVYQIEDLEGQFDYLHEGVKFQDGMYVSCADVKVDGDVYDIDYYVREEDGRYTVVKEVLHKVKGDKVNRVLWEKK